MKRAVKMMLAAAVFSVLLSSAVYAGEWKQDNGGWRWQEDDGSYARDGWRWLDGNGDGTAECYYFYSNGYMAEDTIAEGYRVDKNGCWVQRGQVQTQPAAVTSQQPEGQAAGEQTGEDQISQGQTAPSDGAEPQNVMSRIEDALTQGMSDSLDSTIRMNYSVSAQGIAMDGTMEGTLKMRGLSGTNPEYLMDMNTSFLGQQVQQRTFYTGGYYYMETGGMKYKVPMDMTEALEQTQTGSLTADNMDYLRDITEERHEDGSVTYRFTGDLDMVNGLTEGIMGNMNAGSGMTVSLKRYEGEISLNSAGALTAERAVIDMTIIADDTAMDMHMDMDITINHPGQPAEFELPSTEGYEEIVKK